jgi:hypothetical protein
VYHNSTDKKLTCKSAMATDVSYVKHMESLLV